MKNWGFFLNSLFILMKFMYSFPLDINVLYLLKTNNLTAICKNYVIKFAYKQLCIWKCQTHLSVTLTRELIMHMATFKTKNTKCKNICIHVYKPRLHQHFVLLIKKRKNV